MFRFNIFQCMKILNFSDIIQWTEKIFTVKFVFSEICIIKTNNCKNNLLPNKWPYTRDKIFIRDRLDF